MLFVVFDTYILQILSQCTLLVWGQNISFWMKLLFLFPALSIPKIVEPSTLVLYREEHHKLQSLLQYLPRVGAKFPLSFLSSL